MVPGGVARQPKPDVMGTPPENGWRRPKADGDPVTGGTYGCRSGHGSSPRRSCGGRRCCCSAMRRCSASQASRSLRSRSTISSATAFWLRLNCGQLALDSRAWRPGARRRGGWCPRSACRPCLLGRGLVAGRFFRSSAASALAFRSLISASTACEPCLRVHVGGALLASACPWRSSGCAWPGLPGPWCP